MYTFQTTLNKLFESVFFILKRLVSLNEYDKYIIYYNALFGKKKAQWELSRIFRSRCE